MPKAGAFDAQLQYLKNKLPQLGFFSTLDELIRAAPQERMPAAQWQNYLQPGRTLTREGINFPLKQEEINYSGLPGFFQKFQDDPSVYSGSIHKDELLSNLHKDRPSFGLNVGNDEINASAGRLADQRFGDGRTDASMLYGRAAYPEHAHQAGVPGSYEENVTTSPDFGSFPSHFSPQDISWSRTTRHPVGDDATARLIEEIQSDRHEAAAEKLYTDPKSPEILPFQPMGADRNRTDLIATRRGYRTPEDNVILASDPLARDFPRLNTSTAQSKPPDTPFKDPADYALLELRKQLLNSVNQGDSYLALTRGADQVQRYEQGMGGGKGEGMSYIYDKVYPSALKKLAAQYGAQVSDLPLTVKGSGKDVRPSMMSELGVETIPDFMDSVMDVGDHTPGRHIGHLLQDFHEGLGEDPAVSNQIGRAHQAARQLDNIHNSEPGYYDEKGRPLTGDAYETALDLHREDVLGAMDEVQRHLEPIYEAWNKKFGRDATTSKTFPAMNITPEVADRVKKAGVPLFTLAGLTAAGLGNTDDANANVVEDAALQRDNAQGYGDGGKVGLAAKLAKLMEEVTQHQAARDAEVAATAPVRPPLSQSKGDPLVDAVFNPQPESTTPNPLTPGFLTRPQGMAEGGSTDDSSLSRLSALLEKYGGKHVQRIGTGIAKQFYGLDENGQPAFGGRAWTKDQGGTPAGILDQIASIPSALKPVVDIGLTHNPMSMPGNDISYEPPEWSTSAAARLAALDKQVAASTGVGEAHTLPEHMEDAAAMLATPIPATGELREAPMLRRALEYFTPVRPTTAGRYATDTAALGGTSAGLDALVKRLAAKESPPDNAGADPQIADAALDYTNAEGHAGGGPIVSKISELLSKIQKPSSLQEFVDSHVGLKQAIKQEATPLTDIDNAKLRRQMAGPKGQMTVRVAVHPDQELDPEFFNSPQFAEQVHTQLGSDFHDQGLHPALADAFSLTGQTQPADLNSMAREWHKALGVDIAPAIKPGAIKEYEVGVTGPKHITDHFNDSGDDQ